MEVDEPDWYIVFGQLDTFSRVMRTPLDNQGVGETGNWFAVLYLWIWRSVAHLLCIFVKSAVRFVHVSSAPLQSVHVLVILWGFMASPRRCLVTFTSLYIDIIIVEGQNSVSIVMSHSHWGNTRPTASKLRRIWHIRGHNIFQLRE